jgi:putative flippase GtrA
MILINNKKERTRFLRFAVVGTIGAVVDFGVFNLLTLLTPILPVIASVISFIAAVISNFIWNRYWTYPDSRSKPVSQQVTQFFVINLIGLAIRTPLFAVMEKFLIQWLEPMALPEILPAIVIAHNLSLATAVIVIMFWNFFANRYWTYSDVKA